MRSTWIIVDPKPNRRLLNINLKTVHSLAFSGALGLSALAYGLFSFLWLPSLGFLVSLIFTTHQISVLLYNIKYSLIFHTSVYGVLFA